MGRETQLGVIRRVLAFALLAFGVAAPACSRETETEQPLARAQQALQFTIDGKPFTSSVIGTSGSSPCGTIIEGQWNYADGVVSVTNADGRGLGDGMMIDPGPPCERQGSFDSVNFLSTLITEQDFELVVRVTSIAGMKGAEVGVMLRENRTGDGTGLAGALAIKNDWRSDHCSAAPEGMFNALNRMNRTLVGEGEHAAYVPTGMEGAIRTRPPASPGDPEGQPLWLSLRRFGKDFSVARARDDDGQPGVWVPAGGGEYTPSQAYVGIFAARAIANPSGQPSIATNATFDHLTIRPAGARYRTGALGASMISVDQNDEELQRVPLASASRYVSTGMNGFYVDPSGMSYKYSETNDPGGHEIQLIDDAGALVRVPKGSANYGFLEGGIAGTCDPANAPNPPDPQNPQNCFVYVAQNILEGQQPGQPRIPPEARIHRRKPFLQALPLMEGPILEFPSYADQPVRIRGLSARGTKVFVSDYGRPSVRPDIPPGSPPGTEDLDPDEQQNCLVNSATCNTLTPELETPPTCQPVSCANSQFVRVVDTAHPEQTCALPFLRPGPSVVDHSGNAWVIRPATPYPSNKKPDLGAYTLKYPTAIVCVRPDCTLCNRQINGVANPVAVAVDSHNRLYVADNGPAQNIRIYDNLDTSPTLVSTAVGAEGGVFSGPNPGLVKDPSHGGDHRFYSLLGLGFDSDDNLYVASGAPRTTIQKFPKTGASLGFSWGASAWGFYGLGREIGAFDFNQGNVDYYTLMRRLTLDPDSDSLDFKWKPKSIIRPPYQISSQLPAVAAPIHHFSQGGPMRLRRIDGKRFLYEINAQSLQIFRFVGEVIKPSGHIKIVKVMVGEEEQSFLEYWFDRDEDGAIDPEPEDVLSRQAPIGFYPEAAEDGSIWLTVGNELWDFQVTGWSSTGAAPIYGVPQKTTISTLLPPEKIFRGVTPRFRYENGTSVLYLMGAVESHLHPVLEKRCPANGQTQCSDDCAANPAECCPSGQSCSTSCEGYIDCCINDDPTTPVTCRSECNACGARSCPHELARPVVVKFVGWREAGSGTKPPGLEFDLPTQLDSAETPDDFMMRHADPECRCADWAYTSFDVAGDMFFAEERHGPIHIHSVATGSEVDRLYPGPEVGGLMGWSDITGSMQAFKRPDSNDYLVTTIDSFDHGRNLMFKWRPEGGPDLLPDAWYVASEEYLTLVNGAVAVWEDKTDNHRDIGNTNIYGGRPTYNPTGWNGTQPTVTFNGGNLLRRYGWAGPGIGTEQAFSVMAVLRSAGPHDGSVAAWWPAGGAGYGAVRASVINSAGNGFFRLMRQSDTGSRIHETTEDIGTARHVVVWRFLPEIQKMKITVDGVTYPSELQAQLDAINVDMFLVGASTENPNWPFQGDISELVVVGGAITDQDVLDFRDYAKAHWTGLP